MWILNRSLRCHHQWPAAALLCPSGGRLIAGPFVIRRAAFEIAARPLQSSRPAGASLRTPGALFSRHPGGYLARIRTLNKRSRISCVTVTPRGKNGSGGGHCIASGISVKQQLAQICIPVILRALKLASVAQLVEQKTLNLLVEGSNPSGGTTPQGADTTQQTRLRNENGDAAVCARSNSWQ